jgi:hypothetical protein
MCPSYQRDYKWSDEQNEALIDSLFKNIEIGKFVFVQLPWKHESYGYEVLDGKQRMNALLGFYLNKFPYNGVYYKDLSPNDKRILEARQCMIATMPENTTLEEKIEAFIRLNTAGTVMSQEDIDKALNLKES